MGSPGRIGLRAMWMRTTRSTCQFQYYGVDSQQVAFSKEVIPWLDGQAYVERYVYFYLFPDFLLNDDGNALSDRERLILLHNFENSV